MAVAGLHNVSNFGPSFFGESQPGQPSTRASSLLQMWRDLESEHGLNQSYGARHHRHDSISECSSPSMSSGQKSDNVDDICQNSDESDNQHFIGLEMEHEEDSSIASEQSSHLGEIERERVRQIFREWMNGGSKGHPSYGFNLHNRSGQWLGENECERVRIIREWMQMTAQQRNNRRSLANEVSEFGSQIEQVRDGLVANHSEISPRRCIRKFCGRETLRDLLQSAQNERKEELLGLSEQRPVSGFAHRNRIQALLRGRFLCYKRLVLDERPSSMAATELGLLRQRQTVSDLREEFLSKSDNSASTSVNTAESGSSANCENNVESESTYREREVTGIHTASGLESAAGRNRSTEEHGVQVTGVEDPADWDKEVSEQGVSLAVGGGSSSREEPALDAEARQEEEFTDAEYGRCSEQISGIIANESLLETEEIHLNEPIEVYDENDEPRSDASYVREVVVNTRDLEGNANEEFASRDASSQVEVFQESVIRIQDSAWEPLNTVAFTERVDDREETARSLQEGTATQAADQWSAEMSHNNVGEQDQMQEDWPSRDFQEAIDSGLDMPSGEVGDSVGRIDTFFFPDDDIAHRMEIRELSRRGRVSSLLQSGFRESLNQVLQSHVERVGHASDDWESENTSSPALIEQNQDQQLNGDLSDASERNQFAPTSSFFTSQPLWDEELQNANWPHHTSIQKLGTEWEVINELRNDMVRLQQRMNNMQSMLEACMDIQIELQRSVRQEVSAALNRSIFSIDAGESQDHGLRDESRWGHVRKGICCLCQDGKIDSLLYRCGHVCTCSPCAENLVQRTGKCPMCEAPVVEVVRAYFVQ